MEVAVHTPILDICSVVRDVLEFLSDASETYIIGACRQRIFFVQRQRIRDASNTVDPVSRTLRRSICIMGSSVQCSRAKLIMVREVCNVWLCY